MNELAKQLGSNQELAAKVMELWNRQASAEEIAKVISENGIHAEPSMVEDLLQKMQNKQKAAIDARELDDEELDKVAGGGTGNDCSNEDDCDLHFKECYSITHGQDYRCDLTKFCDESFVCPRNYF